MIPAKTRYEIHNSELSAIIEVLKTLKHYLEDCKLEVLMFLDHNNLQCFMDMKNLNSR